MKHTSSAAQHSSQIRDIVIAGGGTAGWIAAALLSAQPALSIRLTVIDDESGGVGVGEASIPSLLRLLRSLRVDEFEFMRACDATWKLGIQFVDWLQPGHTCWHMFGRCGAEIDGRDFFPFWLTDPSQSYHSFSLHYAAAIAGKSPHSPQGSNPLTQQGAYAFHMDAGKFAGWLKSLALSNGVRHVLGSMLDIERDEQGHVKSLVLNNQTVISGDLFLDCSGLTASLTSRILPANWQSSSDRLLCDRAVVIRSMARSQIPPFTSSQALSAGWMWSIPLRNQTGSGYVYSSQFVNDETALDEVIAAVGRWRNPDVEPRLLQFSTGRRRRFWHHNVISAGLAAGFVEPLESSGLHLIQTAVEELLRYLPDGTCGESVQQAYNRTMARIFDEVLDFVQLHYLLSRRNEAFWQAARSTVISAGLQHRLQLYRETGMLDELHPAAFPDTSYYFLLAGMQQLPDRCSLLAANADQQTLREIRAEMLNQNQNMLRELPLHEEMLQRVHGTASKRMTP